MLGRLASWGSGLRQLAGSRFVLRRRSLISALLIANIVFLSFGVRFHGFVPQDVSIPFPCQGGSCGCRDAYTCWNNCCCNTPAERLAWAEANDVTPPQNIVARLMQEAAIVKASKKSSCCATKQVASCCAGKTKSCCAAKSSSCCDAKEEKTTPAESAPYKGPFFTIAKCGGLPELFAIFSSSVVEPVAPIWSPRLEFCGYLTLCDTTSATLALPPASPPPDAITV
ncbi:hypothetical protein LOC68_21485 [Blastopirellula sp. JC732]|uniref:Uncharacterized protein n=1 Tax=Blastopirellula sediminis TaxID=2894196 RepID=A0A9X1SIM2_9BACT|nr:hypothetical protein [Blastopirellula sediminis]MCC9605729.1 hypothetical protein [Blastopirellula sediminis]MCC9630971.1 hypothetical protein [Blastopirellula sediminis]